MTTPLLNDVLTFRYNPAGIQRAVFAELDRATNGEIAVVDPTNPFVFSLEAASVMTAGFMMQNETNTRKLYPLSAQTEEDLYLHMSDKDFVNRFATPNSATFSILVPLDELLGALVADPSTGYKKIVIPRNSYFTVSDTVFSLQYPVEIRQLAHGGLQIVYDVSKPSPLQQLATNVIDFEIRPMSGQDWVKFDLETTQFSILSQLGSLNSAQDFKASIRVTDLYYYTRVYVEDASGNWQEIATTYTEQVYDIATPTAVLSVVDNVVTVKVPQIYTSTGQLNKGIRMDVYQTKGPLNLLLGEYPIGTFVATWMNYDKADDTVFTAPMSQLRSISPYSEAVVSGGAAALPFAELRRRVIQNAVGQRQVPITNVQIQEALADSGYSIVTNVDNITNRVFLATRPMPDPTNTKLLTAAAASIATVGFSITDAVRLDSVIDNGSSVTVTPQTLFKNVDGITSMVPSSELRAVLALSPEKRSVVVTAANYLYTPFHYVLDTANNEFACRAYYLDSPSVITKLYVAENDTTLQQVATGTYQITRISTGYRLTVTTKSAAAFQNLPDDEVFAQLAYTPAGEKLKAYINGVPAGKTTAGERIFTFDLSTNFKIDSNNNLNLTQFSMFSEELISSFAALLTDFDILYATSAAMPKTWVPNQVDAVLGKFLLPAQIAGLSHETLRIKFGQTLDTLWARSRSVVSTALYAKWEVDVPRYYDSNIYQTDANGSAVQIINGQPQFVLLHSKGDPVLDDQGNPVYLHRQGDVKLDSGTGQPIVLNPRGLIRQVDFMLIEGVYWFATDPITTGYRSDLTATVVGWLTSDLEALTAQLLEQTRLYFFPKTTLGSVDVMVANGLTKTIAAGQAFQVTLYVSAQVFANADLRARLSQSTVTVIDDQLTGSTVSLDAITTALRAQYGNDVISVQVTGLGGTEAYPAVTILNEEDRLSIRKRLTALADGSLIAEEDVTVTFVRHDLSA